MRRFIQDQEPTETGQGRTALRFIQVDLVR